MPTKPSKKLETFPNPNPGRDYAIRMRMPEFTCVCPMTGQPDFATLYLEYVADKTCVELKSLKLYIWSYRDEVVEDAVRDRLVERALVAEAPDVQLQRLQLDAGAVGHVFEVQGREVRLPGLRAQAGELGKTHADGIIPIRLRIGECLQRFRRRSGHGLKTPAFILAISEPVSKS